MLLKYHEDMSGLISSCNHCKTPPNHLNAYTLRILLYIFVKQRYYCRARDSEQKDPFVEDFQTSHWCVRNNKDSKRSF